MVCGRSVAAICDKVGFAVVLACLLVHVDGDIGGYWGLLGNIGDGAHLIWMFTVVAGLEPAQTSQSDASAVQGRRGTGLGWNGFNEHDCCKASGLTC